MIYGGALAAGAVAGGHVVLFGNRIDTAAWGFVAVSLAGTIGYLVGSLAGWGIGAYGGRPLLERHGRWFHLSPGDDRPGGSLVRAPRRLGGLPRPRHAGRPLVHLDPGRRLPLAAPALRAADAARLGDLVLRASPERAGVSEPVTSGYTRISVGWITLSSPWSASLRRGCWFADALPDSPVPMIPLVDVKAQYAPLIPELEQRFAEVVESGRFILGPNVAAFEQEAAAYLGVPATVGVANGTDAIVLVARRDGDRRRRRGDLPRVHLLRDRRGDRTDRRDPGLRRHRPGDDEPRPRGRRRPDHAANEGDHAGAPLRPAGAARTSSPRSGCRWSRTPRRHSAPPGSRTTGVASTFSFFPTKNLFALGDGGLVAATDEERGERVRLLRFHGSRDKVDFDLVGYNSRLDEIQAASLRLFLPVLDGWNRGCAARPRHATRSSGSASSVELPPRRARPRLPHVRRPLARSASGSAAALTDGRDLLRVRTT